MPDPRGRKEDFSLLKGRYQSKPHCSWFFVLFVCFFSVVGGGGGLVAVGES